VFYKRQKATTAVFTALEGLRVGWLYVGNLFFSLVDSFQYAVVAVLYKEAVYMAKPMSISWSKDHTEPLGDLRFPYGGLLATRLCSKNGEFE